MPYFDPSDKTTMTRGVAPCGWCSDGNPEWSVYAKCWIHRRSKLDRKCERPPNRVEQLESALRMAINTVECASIDLNSGAELPWYRNARRVLGI